MSIFVRKDPRLLACADPSWPGAVWNMLRRHAWAAGIVLMLAVFSYAANVILGLRVAAQTGGAVDGLALDGPATIARDARDIPHIRASTLHDLFFAQGFAEASDRLFEMDVTRRYAYGRLAEVFGAKALAIDENQRAANISSIAEREWRHADAQTRTILQAFSDGVNAAQTREPLPVEFRMLLYRPQPWKPQDSLAVSLVAALELGDSWYDVIARDDRWRTLGARCFAAAFPLSDPRYDVSLQGKRMHGRAAAPPSACAGKGVAFHGALQAVPRLGSNAWAAGAALTTMHRALIANDPHVDLTIPGIWYAIDLRAPGFHAAGAVVPGLPGVVLGHNERIAWAVTNAQVATSVVYRAASPPPASRVLETFHVRFAAPVTKTYYRTRDAFSLPADEDGTTYLVRWPPYVQTSSTIPVLLALDRARSVAAATRALSRYRGSPQNFIVAGPGGRIAYHLAGAIYDDPAWGRYVHPARDLARPLRLIPFDKLPARTASRDGVLLSANNRMYGAHYPYRLSAQFEPPFRAYRIAQLLHARTRYDVAYFERMQMDACSPVDAEVARRIDRIAHSRAFAQWNGCFDPRSKRASLEHTLRDTLLEQSGSLGFLLDRLRSPARSARDGIDENASASLAARESLPQSWSVAGRVDVEHPLSAAWYGMLRGAAFPGDGDEYTIHLQEPGFAQGFRAVWEVGDWDAGGIALPSGESGEPGSGHYDDLAKAWIRGEMQPLAFSARAVSRATVTRLVLRAATRARRPATSRDP